MKIFTMNALKAKTNLATIALLLAGEEGKDPKHTEPYQDDNGRWRNPDGTYMTVEDIAKMKGEDPDAKQEKVKKQMSDGSRAVNSAVRTVGRTLSNSGKKLTDADGSYSSKAIAKDINSQTLAGQQKLGQGENTKTAAMKSSDSISKASKAVSDTANQIGRFLIDEAGPAIESAFQRVGQDISSATTNLGMLLTGEKTPEEVGAEVFKIGEDIATKIDDAAKKVYAQVAKFAQKAHDLIQSGWDKVQSAIGNSNEAIDEALNSKDVSEEEKDTIRRVRTITAEANRKKLEELSEETMVNMVDKIVSSTDMSFEAMMTFLKGAFPQQELPASLQERLTEEYKTKAEEEAENFKARIDQAIESMENTDPFSMAPLPTS